MKKDCDKILYFKGKQAVNFSHPMSGKPHFTTFILETFDISLSRRYLIKLKNKHVGKGVGSNENEEMSDET